MLRSAKFLQKLNESTKAAPALDRLIVLCPGGSQRLMSTDKGHYVNPDYRKELAHFDPKDAPIKSKPVEDFIEGHKDKHKNISISADLEEAVDLAKVPEDSFTRRTARIFKPSREATQTAWGNTKLWKIELDNRERWENPNMGWSSSADPMSSVGMHMKFASKEDAIKFCRKSGWDFEVEEPNPRKIVPKSYGENYSWSKKTRIGTK